MSLASILLVGFLLGMKHATEADHLAAVATLAAGRATLAQTVRQGVAWGVGHALSLTVFGGMVLALGKTIPARMEQALEMAVALMLIALGVDALRRLVNQKIQFHTHQHAADMRHLHAHSHVQSLADPANAESALPPKKEKKHELQPHRHGHGLPLRALLVGMTHGMAGTAALILLSLEAVSSLVTGIAYIVLFGVGSIAGMALLSVAIALPLRLTAARSLNWLHNGITVSVGAVGCVLGGLMVYRIALA